MHLVCLHQNEEICINKNMHIPTYSSTNRNDICAYDSKAQLKVSFMHAKTVIMLILTYISKRKYK